MNYRLNKAIYHLCFFDKARKDGLIDLDFQALQEGIATIYCLSDREREEILSFWRDEVFREINSTSVAQFHLRFIETIMCNASFFGNLEGQKEILCSKLEALQYYEKLLNGGNDLIAAFERNFDRMPVLLSFSMLHYLNCGSIPNRLTAELRKNTVPKSFCNLDALLVLLKTDTVNRQQYKKILEKPSFDFYRKDCDRIIQAYFETREVDRYDSGIIGQAIHRGI